MNKREYIEKERADAIKRKIERYAIKVKRKDCPVCGSALRPSGTCFVCPACGNTTGCS